MKIDLKVAIELLKEPVRFEHVGREKEFEDTVLENIEEICECLGLPAIESIHRQKQIRIDGFQVIIDIAVRHIDQTATIFEVKKYNNREPATGTYQQMQAIGQLMLYQNVFEAVTGGKPRLVLIDNKIFYRTALSFNGNNLPIALVELQNNRLFVPYRPW